MPAKAYSTIHTELQAQSAGTAYTKVCEIKSYPDMGAVPDTLETTDLNDEAQTFVDGVQSQSALEFTANFTPENYSACLTLKGEEIEYALVLGENGAQGRFTWTGKMSAVVNGGEVNSVREMTISIVPSSKIEYEPAT